MMVSFLHAFLCFLHFRTRILSKSASSLWNLVIKRISLTKFTLKGSHGGQREGCTETHSNRDRSSGLSPRRVNCNFGKSLRILTKVKILVFIYKRHFSLEEQMFCFSTFLRFLHSRTRNLIKNIFCHTNIISNIIQGLLISKFLKRLFYTFFRQL